MPELVRLYIRNVALGFVLAALFTALLVVLDVAGLRHLTLETRGGWLAIAMLVVANAIVFAGVQFAIAVMRMAEPTTPPGGGLRQHLRARLAPRGGPGNGPAVPVAVPAPGRRKR